MCRFAAYLGKPLLINDVISKPKDSLIKQSAGAMETDVKINGDGFGISWYVPDVSEVPAVFVSALPAWNDYNLKNMSHQIKSPCFFAHVRAAEEGTVSQVNCHPFHYGKYLMMHNGGIGGFKKIKLALFNQLDPEFFSHIKGQTDSEVLFMLWLTHFHRLEKNHTGSSLEPMIQAWRETLKTLELLQDAAGVKDETYINSMISDGGQIVGVRYSRYAENGPLTLHYAAGSEFIYLNHGICKMLPKQGLQNEAVLISSEKLTGETDEWQDIPSQNLITVDHYKRVNLIPI